MLKTQPLFRYKKYNTAQHRKREKIDLLEIIEIRKAIKNNKNVTNQQTEIFASPLLKAVSEVI